MTTRGFQDESAFSLSDGWTILKRRRLWLAGPVAVFGVLGLALAIFLPSTFEAHTDVQILPSTISEQVAVSTIDSDAEAQFEQLRAQLLTRDLLTDVIEEFQLYAEDRDSEPMESLVERMKENITVENLPPAIVDPRRPAEVNVFRIAFRSESRAVVAPVANKLRSKIIDINLESRRRAAQGSSAFMAAEVEKKRREQDDIAAELSAFRRKNAQNLPESLPELTRQLERLTGDESSFMTSLGGLQQRVSILRTQLAELRANSSMDSSNPAVRKRNLELLLAAYEAQGKTQKHPDVRIAKAEMREIDTLLAAQTAEDVPRSPEEARLRAELVDSQARLGVAGEALARIQQEIANVESKRDLASQLKPEFERLVASFENIGRQISEIEGRKAKADIGTSLELQEKGERLRVIETATQPLQPVSPNRPLVFVASIIVGLIIGGALMVVVELGDDGIYTVQKLQQTVDVPVLGTIPVIAARAPKRKLAIPSLPSLRGPRRAA